MRFSTCRTEISLSIMPSTFSRRSATRGQSEDLLLLRNADGEVRGHRVGELRIVLDVGDGRENLRAHLLVELHVVLELGHDRARERLDLDLLADRLGEDAGLGLEVVLPLGVAEDLRAVAALDQHLHGAVGSFRSCSTVASVPTS